MWTLSSLDGVLIAPGFGQRGIEGKFIALKYAREHDIPTFGVCLGMQCMVIEYARDVLGYTDANSTEMDVTTKHNVIDLMEEQKSITNMGGTMRLGAYDCILAEDSIAAKAFEDAGMRCVGENPETHLVEVVEVPSLRWYVGVQYHPEYNSTVLNPNPLFVDFIKAAISKK